MIHHDPDDPGALDAPLDDDLRALIARADAAPTLRPSRDLWPDIAARLDERAHVRPDAHPDVRGSNGQPPSDLRLLVFRARDDARHATAVSRATPRRWHAAAAVALVAVSSGATYLATRPTDAPPAVAPPAAVVAAAGAQDTALRDVHSAPPPTAIDRSESRDRGPARAPVRAVSRSIDATVPGVADYDREIAALRVVVRDGPGDLDSATVDVLARNLRIIDAAIAASRAALARDPHSPFLGDQLTRALGQKVDLLRTAALLPRT